jgi:RNA polymerase sigma factor (sigma-70 family)
VLDQPFLGRGWEAAGTATSDERLAALAGDDRAAFEQLWERHHRGVLAFCRQMLARREDAEDALQQTFLSAYGALDRGATPRRFRAGLYAAARNQCLALREARAEEMLADVEVEGSEALPVVVERREEIRAMLADMGGLPEAQRAALALSALRPMKHEEIGRVLGCSRDEVKALVFQARAALASSRRGRETPCAEIRAQLTRSRRSALRRAVVRRHLVQCKACRAFREELRHQREIGALILMLPPSVGLKEKVMELVFGTAAVAGATGAGIGATALAPKAGAVLAAAAVVGGAVGGAVLFGPSLRDGARGGDLNAAAAAKDASARRILLATHVDRLFGDKPRELPAGDRLGTIAQRRAERRAERRQRTREAAGAGAAGSGGAVMPVPETASAVPDVPSVQLPQTPATGLPAAPSLPNTGGYTNTQAPPPLPQPPLPPAPAVQAPELAQPVPDLPRASIAAPIG